MLKEEFIHKLDRGVMMGEILRELKVLKDVNAASSNEILMWAHWVEEQRAIHKHTGKTRSLTLY